MKTAPIRKLIFTVILFLSLNSIQASPVDLSTGYGEFKWGTSPDALFAAAQKVYGSENVNRSQYRNEGYPEEMITVTQKGVTTIFKFFRGAFYTFTRENSPQLSGYYTKEDVNLEMLSSEAKALFSSSEGIVVTSSSRVTGSSGDRIMGVLVTVTVTNQRLYNEIISELRSKSPDINSILIDPLK